MHASFDRPRAHENLLDGRREPSQGAGLVAVRAARAPCDELGTFVRSDERDVERALAGLSAPRSWSLERRLELLEDVEQRYLELLHAGALELQSARIGYALERRADLEAELDVLEELAWRRERTGRPASGVAWCAAPWCDRPGELFLRVGRAALLHDALILAPDERGAFLADALGQAFVDVGWPSGALALLFGASDGAVEYASDSGRVTALVGRADRERLVRWRRRATGVRIDVDVARARPVAVTLRDLRRAGGAEALAANLVEAALEPFGGQAHGSVGVLHVEPAIFAEFEAAYLAAFETHHACVAPGPLIDDEACDALRDRLALGLDEGATLLVGGPEIGHLERRRRTLRPGLFTNGEERGRLVHQDRPLPVVTLVRAGVRLRS